MLAETVFSVMVSGAAIIQSDGLPCSCVEDKAVVRGDARIALPTCYVEKWRINDDYSVVFLTDSTMTPKTGRVLVRCAHSQ